MQHPTEWAHLTNATHIDRVLTHVRAHPNKWSTAWDTSWYPTRDFIRQAAMGSVRSAIMEPSKAQTKEAMDKALRAALLAVTKEAPNTPLGFTWDTASDALYALLVWDDAGHLLSEPPEVVMVFAGKGVHKAVLLYPAVLAFM